MLWQRVGEEQGQGSRDLSGFLLLRLLSEALCCGWVEKSKEGPPSACQGDFLSHQRGAQQSYQLVLLPGSCKPARGVGPELGWGFPSWQSQILPEESGLCRSH